MEQLPRKDVKCVTGVPVTGQTSYNQYRQSIVSRLHNRATCDCCARSSAQAMEIVASGKHQVVKWHSHAGVYYASCNTRI